MLVFMRLGNLTLEVESCSKAQSMPSRSEVPSTGGGGVGEEESPVAMYFAVL